jgi:hypothetical protein
MNHWIVDLVDEPCLSLLQVMGLKSQIQETLPKQVIRKIEEQS